MSVEDQMHNEQVYFCNDEVLAEPQLQCLELLYDFNQTRPKEVKHRHEILDKLLAEMGDNCYIEPPLHAS